MREILKEISVQPLVKLMINVYPYFAHRDNPYKIPLEYALFTSRTPVQDGPLAYYNLFDAMVDNFYSAMENVGFNSIGVTITESGWPSAGNGQYTTIDLAKTYNSKLKDRINTGMGTPKRPNDRLLAFIFAMFNENQKTEGEEQNFGLFYPNKTPVYPVF